MPVQKKAGNLLNAPRIYEDYSKSSKLYQKRRSIAEFLVYNKSKIWVKIRIFLNNSHVCGCVCIYIYTYISLVYLLIRSAQY